MLWVPKGLVARNMHTIGVHDPISLRASDAFFWFRSCFLPRFLSMTNVRGGFVDASGLVPPHVCSGSSSGLGAVAMSNPHALVFLVEVTHPHHMVHILNSTAIHQFLCGRAKKGCQPQWIRRLCRKPSRTGRTVGGGRTNQ